MEELKLNTFFDATLNGLTLASTTTIDEVTALIDTLSQIDFLGDVAATGTYEFANPSRFRFDNGH